MTWVDVSSSDGLGQPKTDDAVRARRGRRRWCRWPLILVAAALKSAVGPTWQLRLLARRRRRHERGDGLSGDQPVGDPRRRGPGRRPRRRAGGRPGRHAAALLGRGRHVGRRRRCTLAGAVLFMRSPAKDGVRMTDKYVGSCDGGGRRPGGRIRAARHVRADDLGRPRRGARPDRCRTTRGGDGSMRRWRLPFVKDHSGTAPEATSKGIDGS